METWKDVPYYSGLQYNDKLYFRNKNINRKLNLRTKKNYKLGCITFNGKDVSLLKILLLIYNPYNLSSRELYRYTRVKDRHINFVDGNINNIKKDNIKIKHKFKYIIEVDDISINGLYKDVIDLYWDYEKNNDLGLDVNNLMKSSRLKAWWKCDKGHSYRKEILEFFSCQIIGCRECIKNDVYNKSLRTMNIENLDVDDLRNIVKYNIIVSGSEGVVNIGKMSKENLNNLEEEFRERIKKFKNKCGIYILKNKINNKIYIGQSVNIEKRIMRHLYTAYNNAEYNKTRNTLPLYRAIRKYSILNFDIGILEECDRRDLDKKEEYYINLYKSYNINIGYNINNLVEGSRMYSKKISHEVYKNIVKDLLDVKLLKTEIANKYNISLSTLYVLNRGETYKHDSINYPIRSITDKDIKNNRINKNEL